MHEQHPRIYFAFLIIYVTDITPFHANVNYNCFYGGIY